MIVSQRLKNYILVYQCNRMLYTLVTMKKYIFPTYKRFPSHELNTNKLLKAYCLRFPQDCFFFCSLAYIFILHHLPISLLIEIYTHNKRVVITMALGYNSHGISPIISELLIIGYFLRYVLEDG